ncbi:MFS transporter [Cohnella soli]|uniref:MFS transporter n=1 Tax=Cohnella soli TaxID=425005 RepID=A0ABW0HUT0_9BACL
MQQDHSRLWTKSFVALTISSFLLFLNLQMLLSSFPAYVKAEFRSDDMQLSLVTSVFAIAAIGARFMTAALMKKCRRSSLLFIGLGIAALSTGLYVLADSIGSLLVMRVCYGVGFGMGSTIIPTIVSQIIPSRRLGEGIGYFGLSTSLAMSVGPMIGLNVMKEAGFGALTTVGTVTMLLTFPLLLLTRAIPVEAARSTHNQAPQPSVKAPFNSKLLLPMLLNFLLAITYSGLLSFLALFGQAAKLEQVGLFFVFNVITILLIRPISGKVFDRRGHASVLIPAAVFVIASMIVLSYAETMPLLIVSALLYGVGFGAIQPTIQAWMLRVSAPSQHGMANSMFYNSTDLGVAVGAFILGAIAEMSDYNVMYRYSAGVMAIFLMLYSISQLRSKMAKQTAIPERP